jgi:hypothetical protein
MKVKQREQISEVLKNALRDRIEEGIMRTLGRGIGGAGRIIGSGISKTFGAAARAGQEELAKDPTNSIRGSLKAAGAFGKEIGGGMMSGARKLIRGAVKTGVALGDDIGKLDMADKRAVVAATPSARPAVPAAPAAPAAPAVDPNAQRKADIRARLASNRSAKISQTGLYGDPLGKIDRGTAVPSAKLYRRTTQDDTESPLGYKQGQGGSILGQMKKGGGLEGVNVGRLRRKYGSRFSRADRASTELFGNKIVERFSMLLNELSVETLKSYRAKAMAQDPATTPMKREKGISKASGKIARNASGNNTRRNVTGSKSKGNQAYIERGKKGPSKPPMSIDQINKAKGTGREGGTADAHQAAFDKLVIGLSKGTGKKKR